MASTLTTEFAHLQIPLDDVKTATNNFSEENVIGIGGFGKVYKGKLKKASGELLKIAARRLDRSRRQGDFEFWTEISVLSSLKHKNIATMIGFCDENGEKIIIHSRYSKGSLNKHLNNTNLTSLQRLEIAEGIADAINYLHRLPGESYHVIHRNINSSTILLNDKWQPKLSGFEFSIKHQKDRINQIYITKPIGTPGYIDPDTHKIGGVTYKSDVYSMGVVFFEILCGRKAYDPDAHDDNKFLVQLARSHYKNKTMRDIIIHHDHLWNLWNGQYNYDVCDYLSTQAYHCTTEAEAYRIDTYNVWGLLHTIVNLIKNPNASTESGNALKDSVDDNARGSLMPTKVKKLQHLRIELETIKLATSDFSKDKLYQCDSYSTYKSVIECIDREYLFGLNTENKDQLPKRSYNVLIKHITDEEYRFETEIEILGTCKHRNIESFLGFCDEGPGMTLVFEHSFNQCELYTMIYSSEFDFTWEKRLKVSLDISHGLYYLHSGMKDQKKVMHRDITPHNIKVVYESNLLVADSFKAYIAGFQNAVLLTENQHDDALQLDDTPKMTLYTDPEFANSGKLNAESNVFSLGVILFEIFCGMSAEHILITESLQNARLEHVVASWLKKGIIKNKVDSVLKNKNIENALFQYQGLNKDSLDTFIAIACQCLLELPNQRPAIKVIIQELEKSLSFQKNHKIETFGMPFEKIKLATKNSSCVIGKGGFGSVYIGELAQKHRYGHCAIVVKKLDTSHGQGHPQYYNELQILYKYEHENVIGLISYSDETDERLIVYERAPKGSLDRYLNDVKLTWRKRLMICIDIASGLNFLHGGVEGQEVVIHRDIKTPNILLFDDWKAKLGDFGLSLISNIDKDTHYAIDRACGTKGYVDPFYLKTYLLTAKSDIYSFGVVLFEILCGKEIHKIPNREGQSLLSFIRHKFEEGKQDEIVFRVIKEEIASKSLTTFIDIVCMCLDDDTKKRLSSKEVLAQLKKALQLQKEEEDIKALPEDYKKKLEM